MKKLLFVIFMFIVIIGCGQDFTNDDHTGMFNKICIEGHVYYSSGHQLAIKLTDDGRPVHCDKKKNFNYESKEE